MPIDGIEEFLHSITGEWDLHLLKHLRELPQRDGVILILIYHLECVEEGQSLLLHCCVYLQQHLHLPIQLIRQRSLVLLYLSLNYRFEEVLKLRELDLIITRRVGYLEDVVDCVIRNHYVQLLHHLLHVLLTDHTVAIRIESLECTLQAQP